MIILCFYKRRRPIPGRTNVPHPLVLGLLRILVLEKKILKEKYKPHNFFLEEDHENQQKQIHLHGGNILIDKYENESCSTVDAKIVGTGLRGPIHDILFHNE